MKHATGVKRLDDLLKGGVPDGSYTLVYGPPYLGKDILSKRFLLAGLQSGVPGIHILTDMSAVEARRELERIDSHVAEYESRGLLHFIDAYSKTIQLELPPGPSVAYVDGLANTNNLLVQVNEVQRKLFGEHPQQRLVFDSLSTLVTYTNAQAAFLFLQRFIGKTKLAGATGMLLLNAGMHADHEVQMFRALTKGTVEVKNENQKNIIRVEGVGVSENPGWVEYRFDEDDGDFDITGSFAPGRIR